MQGILHIYSNNSNKKRRKLQTCVFDVRKSKPYYTILPFVLYAISFTLIEIMLSSVASTVFRAVSSSSNEYLSSPFSPQSSSSSLSWLNFALAESIRWVFCVIFTFSSIILVPPFKSCCCREARGANDGLSQSIPSWSSCRYCRRCG